MVRTMESEFVRAHENAWPRWGSLKAQTCSLPQQCLGKLPTSTTSAVHVMPPQRKAPLDKEQIV